MRAHQLEINPLFVYSYLDNKADSGSDSDWTGLQSINGCSQCVCVCVCVSPPAAAVRYCSLCSARLPAHSSSSSSSRLFLVPSTGCHSGCQAVCQTSPKLSRHGKRMNPTARKRQLGEDFASCRPRFTKWLTDAVFFEATRRQQHGRCCNTAG